MDYSYSHYGIVNTLKAQIIWHKVPEKKNVFCFFCTFDDLSFQMKIKTKKYFSWTTFEKQAALVLFTNYLKLFINKYAINSLFFTSLLLIKFINKSKIWGFNLFKSTLHSNKQVKHKFCLKMFYAFHVKKQGHQRGLWGNKSFDSDRKIITPASLCMICGKMVFRGVKQVYLPQYAYLRL